MMLFERQKPINDNDSLSITPWNDKKYYIPYGCYQDVLWGEKEIK